MWGITSVLWVDNISTVGDTFSTVGMPSILWGYLQYCGGCSVEWGITSLQWGKLQYCGGYSVHWGITSVHVGDNISTVGRQHQYCRGYSALWRIPCSSVEVVQYSGDNISTLGG